jgi:hypothetical protein
MRQVLQSPRWIHLATVWFLSTATWETMPGERWLLDEEGSAHAKLGAIAPTLLVVRPDNENRLGCEPPDVAQVLEYFRNWASLTWSVRKQ